ncbi:MAG: malonyl CoA-ACP transacylase [Mycobacteriales bacterium]
MGDPLLIEAAAEVAGEPLPVAEVERAVAELRAGPWADRLPPDGSAEGRNLRRWLVQVLTTRAVVEREAAARGLAATAADGPAAPLTLPVALATGGVAAAVLAAMPLARALRLVVTAGVAVPEAEVRAYYDRNRDRYTKAERRAVSLAGDGDGGGGLRSIGLVRRGELPGPLEEAVFAAAEGEIVTSGRRSARVDRVEPGGVLPYAEVAGEIRAALTGAARDRAFTTWLESRHAALVTLHPGYEHPADPSHADATHRH